MLDNGNGADQLSVQCHAGQLYLHGVLFCFEQTCVTFLVPLRTASYSADVVYANSFLATLNTRRVLRGRGTDAETNTMPTFLMVGKLTKHRDNQYADHVYPPESPSKPHFTRSTQSAMEIGIEREVTVTRDSVS